VEIKGCFFMKELITLGFLFIVIAFSMEYFLKKKFNIDRKGNPLSKPIKRRQFNLLTFLFIIYLVVSSTLIFQYDDFNTFLVIIPFLMVISFIRGFMQWKYNRNANIWILETFGAILFAIMFIVIGLVVY
jgi:hypothetical protein